MSYLEDIRIILINTSHPGNIGSAARAMKNMGLKNLYLVKPQDFPSNEAIALASGANDILDNAIVLNDINEALADCQLIYGASARKRHLESSIITPKEFAQNIYASNCSSKIAILFGNERIGLTNDELTLCHQHIVIPSCAHYSSLNLAAAVLIISYELRVAFFGNESRQKKLSIVAPHIQQQGFIEHLKRVLLKIKFLNPKQPKLLMHRLQRLFYRTKMDITEINIMRGLLSRIERIIKE